MLNVVTEKSGETVVLHCQGRIVRGYETAILCHVLRHADQRIVLDLSEVEAIDAAGIGALVALQAAGIYLQLVNPSTTVLEVLQISRLDSIFDVRRSPTPEWAREILGTKSSGMLPKPAASASGAPSNRSSIL